MPELIPEILIYTLIGLLCLAGVATSLFSLSGTWLVALAAGIACWWRWPEFPGLFTCGVFVLLCAAAEVVEFLAGTWGVRRRGGSAAAGWAALGGGLLGAVLGGILIPVPVIGSLIGMFGLSFALAFLVEHRRLRHYGRAADIALGALLARIGVLFMKFGLAAGMAAVLVTGIVLR
ncbi:DUF456 family protein [Kiritimatiella glycovorans]|uniref:DUF456 domain-containing protein n=1 Tax=Kiritimatiella glycovorans TaxID=1307763 RepID=A0A0G3EGI0_9BACT|nr:DUF456 family protein [Kiritimatiella glycovorans]AKJ65576.1 hypothetical protein L21SP4_02350 [Kiritimatiella glycovorans]